MNYLDEINQLREDYYRSTPKQRLHIAKQRINNPGHGPNLIVTYVSAIEGLLRSLVIWNETNNSRPTEETYNKYKRENVDKLFTQYLKQNKIKSITVVSDKVYELVGYAVEYRNLLAHECTYLGQDTYPKLIEACEEFLTNISDNAGIKTHNELLKRDY